MNRAVAIAIKAPTLNAPRVAMLLFNVGLWTLIIQVGRALYA